MTRTIEEIENLWKEDSAKKDVTEMGNEALSIPQLHQKYYSMLLEELREERRLNGKRDRLLRLKREYYDGRMPKEQLAKLKWIQWPHKILKTDLDSYISGDKDIIEIKQLCGDQSDKVEFLKDVLKVIHNRGFHINSAIKFWIFTQGGGGS